MKRLALLAFAFVAGTALAAGQWVDLEKRLTPGQMHATGLDTLTPGQLAALNRVLREEAQDATEQAPAHAAADVAAAPPPRDDARLIGFNDAPIASQVVGTVNGWAPGTEFELANGQRWKVLKGTYTLRKPLESPAVKIVPGAMGRWFFRVDEDTPGARVYRID